MGYEAMIQGLMGEKRYRHSLAVSKQAKSLAKRHGADPEKAALAGLLHDVCKEFPPEKQLEIIEKHGIVLSSDFFCQGKPLFPVVLHQISGPCFLEDQWGITDREVLGAIRWHTTGRPEMSLLEQILYVADVTSQDRDYEDVEDYRALAKKDLEETVLRVLRFTVGDLAKRRMPICPDTIAAYNYYLTKRQ